MMTMVGCDHYDEPFNLVNNDNPDYLKISRAAALGLCRLEVQIYKGYHGLFGGDREL